MGHFALSATIARGTGRPLADLRQQHGIERDVVGGVSAHSSRRPSMCSTVMFRGGKKNLRTKREIGAEEKLDPYECAQTADAVAGPMPPWERTARSDACAR